MNHFDTRNKIVCGTTNCDGCGAPAPTATGICNECREGIKMASLKNYIEDQITEWELPIEGLKRTEAELKLEIETVQAEIRRRELVAGELRKAIQASEINPVASLSPTVK